MTVGITCALLEHLPSSYLFDPSGADCVRLDSPTINDLLEDLAEDHHVQCGCPCAVGSTVWVVSSPASDEAVEGFNAQDAVTLPLDTPLSALRRLAPGCTTLVVATELSPHTDRLLAYRSKRFIVRQHANAKVYQRFGDDLQPPIPGVSDYEAMCSIRGLTFVDKSDYICPFLDHLSCPQLAVVRRPAGFGKTTFLTMLESFFDVLSVHAYFPFMHEEHQLDPFVASAHRRLLVMVMDFNNLQLRDDIGLDALDDECDQFLLQVAYNFYCKYAPYLGEYGASLGERTVTLEATLSAARAQGWQIFLSIDNYTAPTKYRRPGLVQVVGENIFGILAGVIRSGLIRCGVMVGDTMPLGHSPPWSRAPYFSNYTNDLSDDPEFYRAIGFTPDEVQALGQTLSLDLSSHIVPTSDNADPASTVYCAADIVSVARLLFERTPCLAPQRVAILPPPSAVAAPRSPEGFSSPSGRDRFTDDALIDVENAAPLSRENGSDDIISYDELCAIIYESLEGQPSDDTSLSPKQAKVMPIQSTPPGSDTSSLRGSASSRSYRSFVSTMSANSESSDPPASPTDERKSRP